MKVFVSYSFDDDNAWIEGLAMPLIQALGFEVATGKKMAGAVIDQEVENRIRECEGLVAFTTKRVRDGQRSNETHPWVLDELRIARTLRLGAIEVREEGLRAGNSADHYVQIRYRPGAREKMLVELAENLAQWRRTVVRVILVPQRKIEGKFYEAVVNGSAKCVFSLRKGSNWVEQQEVEIQPTGNGGGGSYLVELPVPSRDSIVQISVKKNGAGEWRSRGDSLLGIPVQLF